MYSCRVYRERGDASASTVVLEAASALEHCASTVCDDDVFFGVSTERIVPITEGDRFDVRCMVVSSERGRLLVSGAQLAFTTL